MSILANRDVSNTHVGAFLILLSLIAALFFSGPEFWLLSLSLISLLIWGCMVALRLRTTAARIPLTALTLSLTLFWIWLAFSTAWSKVPTVSFIQFWWISAFPLAFWAYTIDSERNGVWEYAAKGVLIIALLLAFFSICQFFALHEPARSLFITRNSHAAFLNLVALPGAAYLLIGLTERKYSRGGILLLALALYVIFFSISLTTSRGATLSLSIAMLWLVVASMKSVQKRGVLTLLAILFAAFATAHLIHLIGFHIDSRPSLFEAHDRIIIWERAWQMLRDSPWYGIGLGVYFLAWPPYRNPADGSSGFFVHNDYLQLWIEIGLPGLLLLVTLLLLVLAAWWRTFRNSGIPPMKKVEVTGLFCGLLTVAGHSFVDFNFYVISIMMTAGLVLGRFQQLSRGYQITSAHRLQIKLAGIKIYPLIVIFFTLVPVIYLASLGIGDSYAKKADRQAAEALLEEANQSFQLAESFAPWDDRILSAHADLYRQGNPAYPPIRLRHKENAVPQRSPIIRQGGGDRPPAREYLRNTWKTLS